MGKPVQRFFIYKKEVFILLEDLTVWKWNYGATSEDNPSESDARVWVLIAEKCKDLFVSEDMILSQNEDGGL